MHATDIVGYVHVPDGAICPDCHSKLPKSERKELDPIFVDGIDSWLDPSDRGLTCVWCMEEMCEPDTEYAEKYRLLKEETICFVEGKPNSTRYWCVDCSDAARISIPLNDNIIETAILERLECASCDLWILERAHSLVKEFERDWGNVEQVLDPWKKRGFEKDPTADWVDPYYPTEIRCRNERVSHITTYANDNGGDLIWDQYYSLTERMLHFAFQDLSKRRKFLGEMNRMLPWEG
jgi:hypothetical protein